MKDISEMHCHQSKSYLSHVPQDIFVLEFKSLSDVLGYLLGQTTAISVLHDDVDTVVLIERLYEPDEGWSLQHFV